MELATQFENIKPDIAITVADRFETMATAIAASLIATGPQTERQRPKTAAPTVEVLILQPQDYQVVVASPLHH